MIDTMERRIASIALIFGIAMVALILTGCATTEARISNHPEMYQRLSPRDQALVSQGQIRPGMSMDAVWLAWGSPDQKIPGERRGDGGNVSPPVYRGSVHRVPSVSLQ